MQTALRNARGRTVGEAMHEAAIISPDTSIMSAANSIVSAAFITSSHGHSDACATCCMAPFLSPDSFAGASKQLPVPLTVAWKAASTLPQACVLNKPAIIKGADRWGTGAAR